MKTGYRVLRAFFFSLCVLLLVVSVLSMKSFNRSSDSVDVVESDGKLASMFPFDGAAALESYPRMREEVLTVGFLCSLLILMAFVGAPLFKSDEKSDVPDETKRTLPGPKGPAGKNIKLENFAKHQSLTALVEREEIAVSLINAICEGDYTRELIAESDDVFTRALVRLQGRMKEVADRENRNSVSTSNLQKLERLLKDEQDFGRLSVAIISFLSRSVNAGMGCLYEFNSADAEESFMLAASYGTHPSSPGRNKVVKGAGQLGEVALRKSTVVLNNVPKGYAPISSGLGEAHPTCVLIVPLLFKSELYGAMEFGFFKTVEEFEISWIEKSAESIAAFLFNRCVAEQTKLRLEELAQRQAQELVEIHALQRNTYEQLERKLKEAEEERRKNEAVLEGCVDGVLMFNASGTIQFANHAVEEILVRQKENLIGKAVNEFLPVTISAVEGEVTSCYTTGNHEREIAIRTEVSFIAGDAQPVDVLITCTRTKLGAGILFTFFIQKISADLF